MSRGELAARMARAVLGEESERVTDAAILLLAMLVADNEDPMRTSPIRGTQLKRSVP